MGTKQSRVQEQIGTAVPSADGREPWRGGISSWLSKTPSEEVKRVLKVAAIDFSAFWAKYLVQGTVEVPPQVKAADEHVNGGGANVAYLRCIKEPTAADAPAQAKRKWPQSCTPSILADEPELRADITSYGEMVQSVYDTLFTKDTGSQFFGSCRKDAIIPGEKLGKYADQPGGVIVLQPDSKAREYTVLTRIYADSGAYKLVRGAPSYYIGYIAESPVDDKGGVDIAVVFRGTITKSEWFQDAKALQVAWNNGKPVVALKSDSLSGWPLGFDGTWFLTTWLGLQVLSAAYLPLAGVVSNVWGAPPVGWLTGFSSQGFAALGAALAWVLHSPTGNLGGDAHLTSACFLTGLTVGFGKGLWNAWTTYPSLETWTHDLRKLPGVLWNWTWWGTVNVFRAFFDFSQDPHVSYGFKEMYADAQNAERPDGPESPRLTVMKTLACLLTHKYNHTADSGKPHIKSITVTGHSLGGALASLCAWDIANTFDEAHRRAAAAPAPWFDALSQRFSSLKGGLSLSGAGGQGQAAGPDLFARVESRREQLIKAVQELKAKPDVAAVTWAAPRVGDQVFAGAFAGCSVVDPDLVPVKSGLRWILQQASFVVRDGQLRLGPTLAGKTVVSVGLNAVAMGLLYLVQGYLGASNATVYSLSTGAIWLFGINLLFSVVREAPEPQSHVRPVMLRVVDAPDVVPVLPFALPIPRLASYVHGGYELRVCYDRVPYFDDVSWLRSLSELARYHNLEVYLHLLDPQRCIALANRTERVLVKEQEIPGAWWNPVPNNEMALDDDGKTWVKS